MAGGFIRVPAPQIEAQSGGFHENICNFGAVVRRRRSPRLGGRTTGAVQRGRGVTMGHWHLISKDVEANKNLFLGMGAKMFNIGGNPFMMFPGVYINLNLGNEKGDGGTQGQVVNHVASSCRTCSRRSPNGRPLGVPVCRAPTTG